MTDLTQFFWGGLWKHLEPLARKVIECFEFIVKLGIVMLFLACEASQGNGIHEVYLCGILN